MPLLQLLVIVRDLFVFLLLGGMLGVRFFVMAGIPGALVMPHLVFVPGNPGLMGGDGLFVLKEMDLVFDQFRLDTLQASEQLAVIYAPPAMIGQPAGMVFPIAPMFLTIACVVIAHGLLLRLQCVVTL